MFEDIFGKPRKCKGNILLYPVLLKDYAEFSQYSWILKYDKRHTYTTSDEISTLESILFKDFTCEYLEGLSGNDLIRFKIFTLQSLISIVTHKEVEYNFQDKCFYMDKDESLFINSFNFDEFKKIVMEQNLVKPEKFYKSKLVEQWMKDAKETKERKSSNVQFEDIISTIKNVTGCKYSDIYEQTYYQTMSDYFRIQNIKSHDMTVIFASQRGTNEVKIVDMSENLDLQKDPNDSLVKSADSILNKF